MMTLNTFYKQMVIAWTLHFFASVYVVTASPYACENGRRLFGLHLPFNFHSSQSHANSDNTVRIGNQVGGNLINNIKSIGQRGNNFNFGLPGSTRRQLDVKDIPDECRNLGYCEQNAPNYPKKEVEAILAEMGPKLNRLPKEELSDADITDPYNATRRGFLPEYELCHVETRIIYPKMAPNNENKWYYILNRDTNPIQGFKVELCDISQGESCVSKVSFQSGYEASCVQKYSFRTALALGSDNEKIYTKIKLPSCCSCVAKMVFE